MRSIFKLSMKNAAFVVGAALLATRATCFMSGDVKTMVENAEKCQKQNDEAACVQTNTKISYKTGQEIIVQGGHVEKTKSISYAKQRVQLELPGSAIAGREECVQENMPPGYSGPEKTFWRCTITGKKK